MNSARFTGRIAVVTGGASGIGQACAELLAAQGARVVVVDRDPENATRVAALVGGSAYVIDLAQAEELDALAARIESEVGPVDLLVNAAGIIQGDAVRPEVLSLASNAIKTKFTKRRATISHGAIRQTSF